MRIAAIISNFETRVANQNAEIAARDAEIAAKNAELAELRAKAPDADDEAAMQRAEQRFAEAQN